MRQNIFYSKREYKENGFGVFRTSSFIVEKLESERVFALDFVGVVKRIDVVS